MDLRTKVIIGMYEVQTTQQKHIAKLLVGICRDSRVRSSLRAVVQIVWLMPGLRQSCRGCMGCIPLRR